MLPQRKIIGGLGNLMFKEAYIYSQMRDERIPDLYLQDEKYFSGYKDEIKQRFGSGIGLLPYVGIHVRRGDYVDNPFYVDLLKTDYYERAMALFPGERFVVVSDNIEYCKTLPLFKGSIFSERQAEEDDLNILASCKGQILANSSFSWWAAWLCPHPSKVIAPKAWYADGIQRTKLPETWITI